MTTSDTDEGASATDRREDARSGDTFVGDVWVNLKRWNLKAVRNPFVLVALALFFGGIAVYLLSRASSSDVK